MENLRRQDKHQPVMPSKLHLYQESQVGDVSKLVSRLFPHTIPCKPNGTKPDDVEHGSGTRGDGGSGTGGDDGEMQNNTITR